MHLSSRLRRVRGRYGTDLWTIRASFCPLRACFGTPASGWAKETDRPMLCTPETTPQSSHRTEIWSDWAFLLTEAVVDIDLDLPSSELPKGGAAAHGGAGVEEPPQLHRLSIRPLA
mmetsp:Transcript_29805/g.64510  ORF Transcript_29805/g.64510 Transcript_29805/m.64510 type:complete len:116 (-) Transcript_29805:388-735(-)